MNSETLYLCVHSETLLPSCFLISVIYFKDHIEHVICSVSHGPKKSSSNLNTATYCASALPISILKSHHTLSIPWVPVVPHEGSVWSSSIDLTSQVISHLSFSPQSSRSGGCYLLWNGPKPTPCMQSQGIKNGRSQGFHASQWGHLKKFMEKWNEQGV